MICFGYQVQLIFTARKRSLGQGDVLSSVCQGFCPQGGVRGGGCAWQGGMLGSGGVHGRGHAWQGVCMVGGMHGRVGACVADTTVDSYKCLWAFIGGFKRFSGLQSSLG